MPGWADIYEARYLYDQFGYEHAFVVDADGRTLYASTKGIRSQIDPGRLIASGYLAALKRVSEIPTPRVVSGVSVSHEGPLIFGIACLGAVLPRSISVSATGVSSL